MTGLFIDRYMKFGGYAFLQCKKGECVWKFVQLIDQTVPYPVVSLGILKLWKRLYKQCLDTFKQATVADTDIHKVFNSTFLRVYLSKMSGNT